MRTGRLFGVILTMLITGLLLAPTASAQPPFQLPGYVTDNAGALSVSGRANVAAAVDKLYADRHIRLWVVYVHDFSGQSAASWGSAPSTPATWVRMTRCSPSAPPDGRMPFWCRPG